MSLTTSGNLNLSAVLTSALDHGTAKMPASLGVPLTLANGTAANQADLMFSDQRSSASEELDLAGTLTDAFGATITFARIKGILIKAAAANTLDVYVGGAASNAFSGMFTASTHKAIVRPGGAVFFWAPDATAWAVTAGTGDLLKIASSNGTTSITYDIIIIGASA